MGLVELIGYLMVIFVTIKNGQTSANSYGHLPKMPFFVVKNTLSDISMSFALLYILHICL